MTAKKFFIFVIVMMVVTQFAAFAGAKTTVEWMQWFVGEQATPEGVMAIIEEFEKENPDMSIKLVNLPSQNMREQVLGPDLALLPGQPIVGTLQGHHGQFFPHLLHHQIQEQPQRCSRDFATLEQRPFGRRHLLDLVSGEAHPPASSHSIVVEPLHKTPSSLDSGDLVKLLDDPRRWNVPY